MPASSGGRTGCFTFYRDADALSFPRLAGANAALLRAFLALPFVTFTIAAAMHWGAFRLRLGGAIGAAPNAATAITILAASKGSDYTGGALPAAVRRKPDPRGSALVH
jgi:hypothetical protein